jgi:hypothetical protein
MKRIATTSPLPTASTMANNCQNCAGCSKLFNEDVKKIISLEFGLMGREYTPIRIGDASRYVILKPSRPRKIGLDFSKEGKLLLKISRKFFQIEEYIEIHATKHIIKMQPIEACLLMNTLISDAAWKNNIAVFSAIRTPRLPMACDIISLNEFQEFFKNQIK